MKRRDLMLSGAAAIAWRSPARAQQEPMPRIGYLSPRSRPEESVNAFRHGLQELGYVEGKNIRLDVRSSGGDNGRLPELAAELVSLKPAVIVSNGAYAIRAVKNAAGSIPIVMSVIDDPVGFGFTQSLTHPGGNVTGLSNLAEGLAGKRIEMLLEAVPDPGCVAVLHDYGTKWLTRCTGRRSLRLHGRSTPSSSRSPYAVRTSCRPRFHRSRESIARR
jgi:putative ABC transport system substrate-binding protein